MYGLELQKTAKKLPPSVSKRELVMSREGIRVYLLTEFVQFFDNLKKVNYFFLVLVSQMHSNTYCEHLDHIK